MSDYTPTHADRTFPVITWVMLGLTVVLSLYVMAKQMSIVTTVKATTEIELVYLYNNFEIDAPPKFEKIFATYEEKKLAFIDMLFDETTVTVDSQKFVEQVRATGMDMRFSGAADIETAEEAQEYFDQKIHIVLAKRRSYELKALAFFSAKPQWTSLVTAPFVAHPALLLCFYLPCLWLFGRELEWHMGGFFLACLALLGSVLPILMNHLIGSRAEIIMGPYGLIGAFVGASVVFNLRRRFLWPNILFWIGLGLYCLIRVVVRYLDSDAVLAVDLYGIGLGAVVAGVILAGQWEDKFNPYIDVVLKKRTFMEVPDSRALAQKVKERAMADREDLIETAAQRIGWELENKQPLAAFEIFIEYDRATDKLLPPALSLALTEAMLEQGEYPAALAVVVAMTRGSRCGVRTQVELLRLATRYGQKWGLEIAAKLEGAVLPNPDEFKSLVAALHTVLDREGFINPAPAPRSALDNLDLDLDLSAFNLHPPPEVRDVQLVSFEGQQLMLAFQNKTRPLPLQQIQAVAVGIIRELGAKPFLVIDLVLPSQDERRKLLRIRSTEINPKKLFPEVEQPAQGFKKLISLILAGSRGIPLPSLHEATGEPYANFSSLQAFADAVHKPGNVLAQV